MREVEYEKNKHSRPNSKASIRKLEDRENTERLIEIAREEEMLKLQLGRHFDKVNELQAKIEDTDGYRALLADGNVHPDEVRGAARDAAREAAAASGAPRPPLPSWWRDRMTYDWGDALVDDLMGNSSDLTSSPSPYPTFMGREYGRLRRKVERLVRGRREGELHRLETSGDGGGGDVIAPSLSSSSSSSSSIEIASGTDEAQRHSPIVRGGGPWNGNNDVENEISDKLLSDLLRAHRDANGKRTTPVGLASALRLLGELDIPLSSLGIYSHVSLLTCCASVWEGRKVDALRRDNGVSSNGYFWSALVDVYARGGDYRGAEAVLDELIEASRAEYDEVRRRGGGTSGPNNGGRFGRGTPPPIAVPPLSAYTSFFSACHKLISRSDVHPSIKSDAANRAWSRWKEMRIHSVAPDVMAYGALMRIFAAQGRPEQALDLLDEIMMQMMMPVNAENVLNAKNGTAAGDGEILKSIEGDDDGWYDDREGRTVRVKPTTLLFTSALRAVAKSHEIATKFNGGTSKKNRRRESIVSYHGRLARKIVILAEQAEVRQDDGFVSALMLCAAAAGDASTARAIYLASRVRRLDHLRTCGGKAHLSRLQGLMPEDEKMRLLGGQGNSGDGTSPSLFGFGGPSNTPALRSVDEELVEGHEAYEHREYGNDTRPVTALLLAHSKAMEAKGLGSMWAGRYNRGYLCPNSLRYIEAYNQPQYDNMAIPGLNSVEAGLSPEGWEKDFDDSDGKDSKALRKKHKFNIKQIIGDGTGNRKDDQDSFFDGFDDPDEDWRLQLNRGGSVNGEQEDGVVNRDWLNDQLLEDKDDFNRLLSSGDDGISTMKYRASRITADGDGEVTQNGVEYSNDFDSDSDDDDEGEINDGLNVHDSFVRKQQRQPVTDREALVQAMAEVTNDRKMAEDLIPKDFDRLYADNNDDDEGESDPDDSWFDEDEFNKLMEETMNGIDDSTGGDAEELDSIPGVSTNDFAAFKTHLQKELVSEGSKKNVDDKEARQLFDMMRTYYDEKNAHVTPNPVLVGSHITAETDVINSRNASTNIVEPRLTSMNIEDSRGSNASTDSYRVPLLHHQRTPTKDMSSKTIYADDYIEWANSHAEEIESNIDVTSSEMNLSETESTNPIDLALPRQYKSPLLQEEVDAHIIELQNNLPGMPINRIEKVADEFSRTLGYPSILRLTLAVRENMPESFSPQCLTRVNLANAKHVMVSNDVFRVW
jgi:pentatricopeptide repeat protein